MIGVVPLPVLDHELGPPAVEEELERLVEQFGDDSEKEHHTSVLADKGLTSDPAHSG
jgi:hypothetical protein